MISTLKVQTPETDLIEKIKAAISKRAEAKAKRMFLQEAQEARNLRRDHTSIKANSCDSVLRRLIQANDWRGDVPSSVEFLKRSNLLYLEPRAAIAAVVVGFGFIRFGQG